MSKSVRLIIPLVVFILMVVFLILGLSKNPHQLPSALIGRTVPAFTSRDVWHANKKLTGKIFQGHISLLNVFASWCVSCRVEHPTLMDLRNKKDLQLVGLDYKDNVAKLKTWFSQDGNPFRYTIADPSGKVAIDFGVYGTPETFVIDPQGFIRYKYIGPLTKEDWQHILVPIINKIREHG